MNALSLQAGIMGYRNQGGGGHGLRRGNISRPQCIDSEINPLSLGHLDECREFAGVCRLWLHIGPWLRLTKRQSLISLNLIAHSLENRQSGTLLSLSCGAIEGKANSWAKLRKIKLTYI